jgi:hypothetical protein
MVALSRQNNIPIDQNDYSGSYQRLVTLFVVCVSTSLQIIVGYFPSREPMFSLGLLPSLEHTLRTKCQRVFPNLLDYAHIII